MVAKIDPNYAYCRETSLNLNSRLYSEWRAGILSTISGEQHRAAKGGRRIIPGESSPAMLKLFDNVPLLTQ